MWVDSYSDKDIPGWGEAWWQVSEAAKEKFNENLRKAQAAQKKAAITEKKFKGYDNTLAVIIQYMLSKGGYDKIIYLVADLIENNVPSDFILAILSIVDENANKQANMRINDMLWKIYDLALSFDSKIENQMYEWVNVIYSCAIVDKEKVLSSLINHDTWECLASAHLLFFEIAIKILEEEKIKFDREEQKQFAKSIFNKITENLQTEMY